jgi:hypothetical protein
MTATAVLHARLRQSRTANSARPLICGHEREANGTKQDKRAAHRADLLQPGISLFAVHLTRSGKFGSCLSLKSHVCLDVRPFCEIDLVDIGPALLSDYVLWRRRILEPARHAHVRDPRTPGSAEAIRRAFCAASLDCTLALNGDCLKLFGFDLDVLSFADFVALDDVG